MLRILSIDALRELSDYFSDKGINGTCLQLAATNTQNKGQHKDVHEQVQEDMRCSHCFKSVDIKLITSDTNQFFSLF